MAKSDLLNTVCSLLFPLAFAGVAVGVGCPVWLSKESGNNTGLWQTCATEVFKDCSRVDFDFGEDWLIGVRSVEIFALVMLFIVAVILVHHVCCANRSGQQTAKRIALGILCFLGGGGGVSGVIVYAVEMEDAVKVSGVDFGWAFMLVAAASSLALILGTGFFVSGACYNAAQQDSDKAPINAYGSGLPYAAGSSRGESLEMSAYSNKALMNGGRAGDHSLPRIGGGLPRSSISGLNDPYYPYGSAGRPYSMSAGPPMDSDPRAAHYYYGGAGDSSYNRPEFDLSEGYLPASRARAGSSSLADNPPYYVDGGFSSGRPPRGDALYGDDPYLSSSRGGRGVDEGYGGGGGGERGGYDEFYDLGGGRPSQSYKLPRF